MQQESLDWKPRQDVAGHTPVRETHALIGNQRHPAERAVEVEVVEPSIEAFLVEDVAAG